VEGEVSLDDLADRIIFLMALGVLLWVCWQGATGGLA
jgi:hypothetical protein